MRVETGLWSIEVGQYAGQGQSRITIGEFAAVARKVEELGFDAMTMPEAGHDPFLPLVVAAEHTKRLTLGTNVAIAFPRSPMVTAQIAWDLQQMSGGRFQLGLGTQVKGHNERRYCAPWVGAPGPRLREYVLSMRAMFETFADSARPKFFKGQHYQFTLMSPFFNPGSIEYPHPPIYIAVINTYMARLAGELCEGLRLHPLATFRYAREVIVPQIEAGARKAGRRLSDVDHVGAPFLAIGKNREEVEVAKQALKQRISFYASTRTYHSVLAHHGWEEIGLQLHQLSLEGKWREMANLIADDMLEEWAVIGTYDEVVPRVKECCAGLFSTVMLDLPARVMAEEEHVRRIVKGIQQL